MKAISIKLVIDLRFIKELHFQCNIRSMAEVN